MNIFGYEIDIYLVIVVIAGIFVLSLMFLMGKSMIAGKPASRKAKKEPKLRPTVQETPQDKIQDNLPEKPAPTPQNKPAEEPQLVEKSSGITNFQGTESTNTERGAGTSAGTGTGTNAPVVTRLWETEEMKKEAERAGATVGQSPASQPSTSQETKEEPQEQEDEEGEGIMDIFDEEAADESGLADLAAKLTDVDLNELKKLGTEVSRVLGKNTPTMHRR